MIALFLHSLKSHLSWWYQAITRNDPESDRFSWRRLLFLIVLFPLFYLLQLTHWIGFLVDECCFRNYRKVEIKAPLFISGIPRSGTTFVHRTLAVDTAQFTTFSTWQAVLAPSISQRKCIQVLSQVDQKLNGFFGMLLNNSLNAFTSGMDDIHRIDLTAPEEDYLCLLPAGACFILSLAFPEAKKLAQIGTFNELPGKRQDVLLEYYHRCLQKHLYMAPAGTRLLSKNAAFASWIPALLEYYPDAQSMLCIRDPESGLSSQLSSLTPARQIFGTDPSGKHTAVRFTQLFQSNLQTLADWIDQTNDSRCLLIDQNDLKNAPADILRASLKRLNIQQSQSLEQKLDSLKPTHKSQHVHQAQAQKVDTETVASRLHPIYQKMLESSKRIHPSSL